MQASILVVSICALAPIPPSADAMSTSFSYRIELTRDTGGLDVGIQTSAGPAVVVGLENRSVKTALCAAAFQYYPHAPLFDEIRWATVEPGKRATLGYPVRHFGRFSTGFVQVKCAEKSKSTPGSLFR